MASRWCQDQSRLLLELVWRGYDRLLSQDLNVVPFSDTDEAKEKSLNTFWQFGLTVHERRRAVLRRARAARADETETRERAISAAGYRVHAVQIIRERFGRWKQKFWPTTRPSGLTWLKSTNNFITCRYATFSSEGAMLGYLLHGEPERTFAAITTRLRQNLILHPHFLDRPQRISHHQRDDAPHMHSPREFTCHHLLLCIPTADATAIEQ